jgi:hypothetical protein
MLTLFKSLVLSRLDYGSQLWSPCLHRDINAIERIQRSFTKHVVGLRDISNPDRLKRLRLYSLQRRRERYIIMYIWKILEAIVPNLSIPITSIFSDRRGRSCYVECCGRGHIGTLSYNSFRWKAVRLFNSLPIHLRNMTACSVASFKKKLDPYLQSIFDNPSVPNYNNSLDNIYNIV